MSAGPCWRQIAMRWGAFLFLRAVVLSFPGKSGSSSPAQASGHPLTFAAEQSRLFSIRLARATSRVDRLLCIATLLPSSPSPSSPPHLSATRFRIYPHTLYHIFVHLRFMYRR